MSSGALNLGETRFMRPLFPALDFSSLKRFMTSINIYLVNPFRWWLIIFTFLGGLVYWIRFREAWKSDPHHYFNIFILLLFSLLIENETLILINRPITFFINMLPSYILLALVFVWLKNKDWVWSVRVSAFLLAFFFFYPPFRMGYFYFQYGKPLALPYAKTIRVPPYSWEGYRTIAAHVARQAPSNKPFLFAGYDSFIYFFSGRELYFPDDFATFIRASFHPYNQTNDYFSKSFFDQIERKIIERIEENRPGMIMVPSSWISEQTQKYSLFLKYLNDRWQLEKVLSDGSFKNCWMTTSVSSPSYVGDVI